MCVCMNEKVRINITIPEELNKALDEIAGKLGVTKSELIEYATKFYTNLLMQKELQDMVKIILKYFLVANFTIWLESS